VSAIINTKTAYTIGSYPSPRIATGFDPSGRPAGPPPFQDGGGGDIHRHAHDRDHHQAGKDQRHVSGHSRSYYIERKADALAVEIFGRQYAELVVYGHHAMVKDSRREYRNGHERRFFSNVPGEELGAGHFRYIEFQAAYATKNRPRATGAVHRDEPRLYRAATCGHGARRRAKVAVLTPTR
jgi:hypothetical protein